MPPRRLVRPPFLLMLRGDSSGGRVARLEKSDVRRVIYSPPADGLPYLSVAFIAGEEVHRAIPFDTAEEAQAFHKHAAGVIAPDPAKGGYETASPQRADKRLAESLSARLNLKP